MRDLGNVLWMFLGGGFILFFEYMLGGVILCVTVVGIPFGLQCIKLSMLALLPFGKEVSSSKSGHSVLSTLLNFVWILTAGIPLALTHLVFGILCAVTVIGIPFAKQHMKLASFALTPFGHDFT